MKITESQLRSIIRETIINESRLGDLAKSGAAYVGNKLVNFAGKDEVLLAYEIFNILMSQEKDEIEITSELDKILVKHSDKTPEELDKVIQLFSDVISHLELYKNPKNEGYYEKNKNVPPYLMTPENQK
tara:strand:+ start:610 stop:996 length:387 start_codon:yes stop_codon:yes gene_type:complete